MIEKTTSIAARHDSAAVGVAVVLGLWVAVSLGLFKAMTWNQVPVYTPTGVFQRHWTESVFLLPWIGLLQPFYCVPAFFALRRLGRNRIANGLLRTTLAVFVLSIGGAWIVYMLSEGMSGLR